MVEHFKLFSVLLLALFTFSVSGELIASINCGASKSIDDLNSITWTGDDSIVSNGDARVVQSSNLISPVMDTLRVFTTRIKNCYSVPVTKGQKVLVRASFYYGNYDGLSSPPTFDLHFDGNFWSPVITSSTNVSTFEIIYVAKGNDVSVCVAQTIPDQFPFISALEVRGVDSEVYSKVDENRALYSLLRSSYGANQTVRYPSDPYDRMWKASLRFTDQGVTSDATSIDSTAPDNPPVEILETAVSSKTNSLILASLSPLNGPYYINFYFSEAAILDSSKPRSFKIYGASNSESSSLSPAISPPFGSALEYSIYNYSVDSVTTIYINVTDDSYYTPLINAIEVLGISEVLTDGTDSNDVEALALLQKTFKVLGEWNGDPCLPANYSWDWLSCSDDATPRVTSLYLDSFELSGILPDISSMDALEIIDLHNNSLTGTIPSFLGTMPNLQQLNLADNQFIGPIPTSLSNNNKLKLTVSGNPSVICTSGQSCLSSPGTINSSPGTINSSPASKTTLKKKKKSMLPVVLGITIPIFFLIWVAAGIFIILRRKTKRDNANMQVATGGGAKVNYGGGTNGNSNGLQKNDEEQVNETVDNGVQHTFPSPSPLLHTSGNDSD